MISVLRALTRPSRSEVEAIFEALGGWLAAFVLELGAYLPFKLTHAEAGGKLTDAASGEVSEASDFVKILSKFRQILAKIS